MKPITSRLALAIVAAGIITAAGTAQTPPSPDQIVASLKQNLAESQKRLRTYEWIETTAISLKGEEKSRKQQRVYTAQTTLDAAAKNIRVVVQNAGHRPLAR